MTAEQVYLDRANPKTITILRDLLAGLSKIAIARRHKVSRQRVYEIEKVYLR